MQVRQRKIRTLHFKTMWILSPERKEGQEGQNQLDMETGKERDDA